MNPIDSSCSLVIPLAWADLPEAYSFAPLSFNTLRWSDKVPKPTPCISFVVISCKEVTPSPAQNIVTSFPSSIADLATKKPSTERLGFSTPVIICTNNLFIFNNKHLKFDISNKN